MYVYNILVCKVGSKPLSGTDLNTESRVNTQYINSLRQTFPKKKKTNITIRKMHWLAQGLGKVKFRWNQVSLRQHRI